MNSDAIYSNRSRILLLIILTVGLLYGVRLFYIQVLDSKYKVFAENNSIRREVIFPPRGIIYDRNGKIIVRNETIYDLMVVPAKIKSLDTSTLCRIIDLSPDELRNAIEKGKSVNKFVPAPIVRRITSAQYGRFQERAFEFRGFFVQARTARTYPVGSAAHVIGYLGEVTDGEINNGENYYRMGDYVGKTGIERAYEKELRGIKGERKILVDVLNREQGRYRDGEEDIASVAGNDLYTTLDLDLQLYAEKLMAGKRGSVVAIEPSTGDILAMVSTPGYDLNMLQGRDRAKNYAGLLLDPEKPMFNRAISAMYPPGSTLKPVEAVLGLHEGVITESTTFNCPGGYRLSAAHTIGCHSAGTFDVHGSIRMSCNTYYCYLFRLLVDQKRVGNTAAGLDRWGEGLQLFGLGTKTGLDLPHERKGILPSSKLYNKFYGENRWKSSTIISLGIGQAEISITPLQLACAAATIANRGFYYSPHVAKKIAGETIAHEKHNTGIAPKHFQTVALAMQDVIERGTAYFSKIPGLPYCGKTGTAENPHGADHSLFIAFAPQEKPAIALSVVIENAGFGGTWAAPLGSLLIEKYIRDSISRPRWEEWVLSNLYIKKLQRKQQEEQAKKDSTKAKSGATAMTEAEKQAWDNYFAMKHPEPPARPHDLPVRDKSFACLPDQPAYRKYQRRLI